MTGRYLFRLGIGLGGLAALLLALVLIAGAMGLLGGSVGGTLATGRSVSASSDGFSIGMESQRDTAIIRTCGYRIVVAPTQVTVDGQRIAALDSAAKNVDLAIKGSEITVVADGKTLLTIRR